MCLCSYMQSVDITRDLSLHRKGVYSMSSQQVVLVTGSKSGFGRRIVETLARQGHRVFASLRDVNGRNASSAKELRDFAQREHLALSLLDLDVTDETSDKHAVQAVIDQAERIDVLVNNAGVT